MKRFDEDSRPNIRYPTKWKYTVIGADRAQLESAVAAVVENRSHSLRLSNVSARGRYTSLTLELIVLNEGERLRIFEGLRDHPSVKIVL